MTEKTWKKMGQTPMWNGKGENGEFNLKAGDALEGTFIKVQPNVGANHANVYTFKTNDGEMVSVWGSTILDTRFENLNPGEEVMIKYLGLIESKQRKGAHYHSYEVFHRESEKPLPIVDLGDDQPDEVNVKDIPF